MYVPLLKRNERRVGKRTRIVNEIMLSLELGVFEIRTVMLDLGVDMSSIPKKTWELMANPTLVWFPIQIRL